MNQPVLCGSHSTLLPILFFFYDSNSSNRRTPSTDISCDCNKSCYKDYQHHYSLWRAQAFEGQGGKCKRGTSWMHRVISFFFALRVDTRVALKLNTRTFGKTKRALGPTRRALGPSVRGTLGAL